VSRFLLLLLFLIWMGWRADGAEPERLRAGDLALFFGFFGFLVGVLGLWSRSLTKRLDTIRLERAVRYFKGVMAGARAVVPIWFGVGVFYLGWGHAVQAMLGPVGGWPVQVPGAVIGVLPAILTWAGLWWAQYPADHALRERRLMVDFNDGLQLYRPPPMRQYLMDNLRLQVLFTAIPILLILALHDFVMLVLWRGFDVNIERSATEGFITFACALCVFVIVPEVLVRVLPTHRLPNSPLRQRMETMARAQRMRFRDILIWQTDSRIANALVMGVVPRFRYVLLSDLLLGEMSDEQVEAVFAHELGHVVHRHMIWYIVFLKVLVLVLALITVAIEAQARNFDLPEWLSMNLVMTLIGFAGFVIGFGYVSRRFERQADVFAARTLQRHLAPLMPDAVAFPVVPVLSKEPARTHVGPLGATLFASALERVAVINNMPLHPRGRWEGGIVRKLGYVLERFADLAGNWLHGSIPHRMRTLHRMSSDPRHTFRFDRYMARLYVALIVVLLVSGVLVWRFNVPL
jgi:STE24 endopeptidase